MGERTHYEILDADPGAAKADLKAAYVAALEVAQAGGDDAEASAVRRAWQVLSDPVQRGRYDEAIGVHRRGGTEPTGAGPLLEGPLLEGPLLEGPVLEGPVLEGPVLEGPAGGDDAGEHAGVGDAPNRGDDGGSASWQQVGQHAPEFLEQPTLGRRITASLIDVVTTLAVFLVSITVTFQITGADSGLTGVLTFMGWAEFWILALYLVPTYRTGQTLGKRMTYVMTVDRGTGELVSVGQAIRRYIVPMVAIPALFQMGAFLALFFGLSYAMGRDQLSLADRLAKTVVVVARYKPTRSA